MRFTVLGPVEIRRAGGALTPVRAQPRGLLAYLLLNANHVVSLDAVVEALWGGAPPATARSQVHSAISGIRRLLRDADHPSALESRAGGYVLRVDPDDIDVTRFQRLVAEARSSGDGMCPRRAQGLLREGLKLWQGPALANATGAFVEPARARLADQRLSALEDLVQAELALGRHVEVVSEFGSLVDEHPLRERLRGQLMLALYRGGRQVEALANYQEFRKALAEAQGLDPGQPLRTLEQAILRADPALDLVPGAGIDAPEAAAPAGSEVGVAGPDSGTMAAPEVAAPAQPEEADRPADDGQVDGRDTPGPAIAGVRALGRLPPRLRSRRVVAATVASVAVVVLVTAVGAQRSGRSTTLAGDRPRAAGPATVVIVNEGPLDVGDTPHVVGIAGDASAESARVQLSAWAVSDDSIRLQIWSAEDSGRHVSGFSRVRFRNVSSHKCLDRADDRGAAVFQAACNDEMSQLWFISPSGTLKNDADGLCLDIVNSIWHDGATLKMAECGAAWTQKWYTTVRTDWS